MMSGWRVAGMRSFGWLKGLWRFWNVAPVAQMTAQVKHFKCRYRYWSGHHKKKRGQRPHLLLYGTVAFVWERERITNEEVMSCLKEYLDRISSKLSSNPGSSVESLPATASSSSATSSANKVLADSNSGLFSWLYAPSPSDSHTAKSVPTDSLSSPTSPSSIWGYLTWAQNLFPWSSSPVSESSDRDASPSQALTGSVESSSASYSWRDLSWAQTLFSWSSSAVEMTTDKGTAGSVSGCDGSSDTTLEAAGADPEHIKREEFVNECLRYYKAHTEERTSQLVARKRGQKRLLRRVLGVMEGLEERTRAKLLVVLSKYNSQDGAAKAIVTSNDSDDLYSSLSDWACVGGFLTTPTSPTLPALHSTSWVKGYMQLELYDPTESQNPCLVVERDKQLLVLLQQGLKTLLDDMKPLALSSVDYLKDQFLMEDIYGVNEPVLRSFKETVAVVKSSFQRTLSEVLDRFNEENALFTRHKELKLNFSLGSKVKLKDWLSLGIFPKSVHTDIKLQVITNTMAEVLSMQAFTTQEDSAGNSSERDDTDQSGYIWSWEVITKHCNYTAYHKPYKDTGLFQYKVIGHYDDITAKDFFEAQVDQESRKSWDAYAGNVVTLECDRESNCRLIHWIMKYPFPMSNREYLFVQRSWVTSDQDTIIIMNRSASHPEIPDTGKYVRVRDYFSHMIIKSPSHINELGLDFELTYFDNPEIQLPSSCANWVASTAMPDFMNKLHQAALMRHNKLVAANY